jgi:hypothetical protein
VACAVAAQDAMLCPMIDPLRKFGRLSWRDRLLLVEAAFWLAIASIVIAVFRCAASAVWRQFRLVTRRGWQRKPWRAAAQTLPGQPAWTWPGPSFSHVPYVANDPTVRGALEAACVTFIGKERQLARACGSIFKIGLARISSMATIFNH